MFNVQRIQQLLIVELAIPTIDLRNLFLQVCQIALGEAAHHKELLDTTLSLGLCKLQDGIDTFLFGVGYEAAGIDDNYLALRVVAIVRTVIAVGLHQAHEHLAVNEIL